MGIIFEMMPNYIHMKLKKNLLLLISVCCFALSLHAQEIKSTKVSTVNGVKYYMHTVAKGQTLYAIAKLYERTVSDIVIENPESIDGIKPGDVLKVTVEKNKPKENKPNNVAEATPDTASYLMHKVTAGQTLFAIAKQYNVSIEKLKTLNPLLTEGLKAGQSLKIQKKQIVQKAEENKSKPLKKEIDLKPIEHTATVVKQVPETKSENAEPSNYSGQKKEVYQVAVFLPFHAAEANAIDKEKLLNFDEQLPNRSVIALQFYEGILLAIDSLEKIGVRAKLHVFDIDDTDSSKLETILKKTELSAMDLFIGPLYGSSFQPFAKFAKKKNIPIVSPFMQVNKILFNNPYVCKLQASSSLQLERMAQFVVDSFPHQQILVIDNANAKEAGFLNSFKNTANELLHKKNMDTIGVAKGFAAMQSMLITSKKNVVVLPSNNQSYVTEFVSRLNILRDKYKIVLCGMQSWQGFDNIDLEYFNNLSLHFPSNTFVNYQDTSTKIFLKNYRERFKTEPETYAYQGFDASLFFISELHKNGSGFLKNVNNDKYKGIICRYSFLQYPSDSGFENKSVFILKYKNLELIPAN
jgi:LysM repeat protein/ABC-type branched-subunit amino acid transport system substrate-binding protein